MTPPELLLWQRLRGKPNGFKFRRQHPIGPFIVDFFCAQANLVVEIDGAVHDNEAAQSYDHKRQQDLESRGLRVARVSGADVMSGVDTVAAAILALAESPLHHSPSANGPPPRSGEE